MAEVFGVVASAIALLHLTAKGARILQSIPEIESDFEELCEEVSVHQRQQFFSGRGSQFG